MTSSLYNLALDFSKELNYTKAIMARQGDKGITVTVKPFLNGLQMDTSGGTFTLKGTTPSNRYVDSVATSVTSDEVTFSLDGTFMSEAGYYKHCYVEYRKDDQVLTTQDIIFFSLGVSDISQGQADEYVSQLEELIRKYNETFDAFMAEIKGRVDSLNKQITDLTVQAKTLQDKLDALKEEIAKLGNLFVMYSNSVEFDDNGEYKYRGIGMRDSKNLEDFVWDLAPKYVEENLATENKITEIVGEANKYTDDKASQIALQLTTAINEVDTIAKGAQTLATANEADIKSTNNRIDEIQSIITILTKEETYSLPASIVSGGSLKFTSRGGITVATGSFKLAKDIAFGEVLVNDLPDSMINIDNNAIGTGAVTGNSVAQLYVESNTKKLIANTAMKKDQWLTVGLSYHSKLSI